MSRSRSDVWIKNICRGRPDADVDELKSFVKYAQLIGIVTEDFTPDDLKSLCSKYFQEKKRLTEKSVTGGLRLPNSYTKQAQDVIDLVTIQPGVYPVGTYKFNVHKYASDIDIMERFNPCCDVKTAKEQAATGVQKIANLIRAAPNVYLGDFKAGKDDRFSINIGSWVPRQDIVESSSIFDAHDSAAAKVARAEDNKGILTKISEFLVGTAAEEGVEKEGKVSVVSDGRFVDNEGNVLVGYDSAAIEQEVRGLRRQRLISQEELIRILDILKKAGGNPTPKQWEELKGLLRDHQVLRWNIQELIRGYKMLPGFQKLTLEEAIGQKTLVKVDVWALINGRWLEVTNYFIMGVVDNSGNMIENLTQEMPDYVENMKKDIRHYSSLEHRKTFKALKRLWALAVRQKDYELAQRINPIFATPSAALNQVSGDAEVLGLMLENLDDPPIESIMDQIDAFKPRVDQLNPIPELNPQIFNLINSITKPFYAKPVGEYVLFSDAIEKLSQLQEIINGIVEKMILSHAIELDLQNPAGYI